MFISKKHISRRTVLRGMGATIALPLLDAMVPAGVARRRRRRPPRRGWRASRSVHGTAGATAFGASKHLWSPAATGRGFDLSPTAMASLEPYRDYLTIISNTTARGAEAQNLPEIGGDHFRSSAVFLTQAHPKQTQGSDVEVGISLDQIHAQRFGQDTPIPVDAAVHREHRSGGQLRLRLRLRLHGHDQLGVADPAAADGARSAGRVRSAVRTRGDAEQRSRAAQGGPQHPRLGRRRVRARCGRS